MESDQSSRRVPLSSPRGFRPTENPSGPYTCVNPTITGMASIDATEPSQFTQRQLTIIIGGWLCLVIAAGIALVLALP